MLSKVHKNAYLGPELTFTRSRSRLGTLWSALPQEPSSQRLCGETPIYVYFRTQERIITNRSNNKNFNALNLQTISACFINSLPAAYPYPFPPRAFVRSLVLCTNQNVCRTNERSITNFTSRLGG